jgi:hypothetical protein
VHSTASFAHRAERPGLMAGGAGARSPSLRGGLCPGWSRAAPRPQPLYAMAGRPQPLSVSLGAIHYFRGCDWAQGRVEGTICACSGPLPDLPGSRDLSVSPVEGLMVPQALFQCAGWAGTCMVRVGMDQPGNCCTTGRQMPALTGATKSLTQVIDVELEVRLRASSCLGGCSPT